MPQVLRQVTLVATVASVVMFTNLGGARLWDRDEPRNAECAAEMQARGDWVTPVMNAELRTHKPVLLYWLMMTAYSVFGVNEFSARFWSAALAVGTSLCTFAIGRRLFDERVGVWAGIIIATALMFDVAGRAATPDSALIFFSTLAITIYVLGTFPGKALSDTRPDDPGQSFLTRQSRNQKVGRALLPVAAETGKSARPTTCAHGARLLPNKTLSWLRAVAMYGAMGVAILAKGPVGLALPTAVIGMFLLVTRLPRQDIERVPRGWWHVLKRAASCFGPRHFLRTCWSMRPVTACGVSLAVALPWYIWVGIRTDGEFLRGFFLEHNLARATQAMEGHNGSILFYPAAVLVGFFPWSVFAAPVILDTIRHGKQDTKWTTGYLFAACWIGVYVGLFSLAQTKLPSYVTPCYPGLALLTACFVDRWTRCVLTTSQLWFRVALGITALVGVGFLIGVPIAALRFLPGDEWLGAIGLIPLASGVLTLLYSERKQPRRAAYVFAGSAILFATVLLGGALGRVDRHQRNDILLQAIAARGADAQVASYGLLEPSWIFYGQRSIDELIVKDVRTPSPTWIETEGNWVQKPDLSVDDFLCRSDECLIITSDQYLPLLRKELPKGYEIISQVPYFMRKGNLVLVAATQPRSLAEHDLSDERTTQR